MPTRGGGEEEYKYRVNYHTITWLMLLEDDVNMNNKYQTQSTKHTYCTVFNLFINLVI